MSSLIVHFLLHLGVSLFLCSVFLTYRNRVYGINSEQSVKQ